MAHPRDILGFWFSDRARPLWFKRDAIFDAELRDLFGAEVHLAQSGNFEEWRETQEGSLALVLLLDQFARNIHRGLAKAFLGDGRALEVARIAIDRGFDRQFGLRERLFFYLPFEHAEDAAAQEQSIRFFTQLADEFGGEATDFLRYARLHQDVIVRFGRFPQRNAALGRASTEDETAFLQGPDPGF